MPHEIHYHCQRCTACCRWPGQVKVSAGEIASIAAFLGVDEAAFIQRLTRLRTQRDGLALIDKPNGECFFLDGADCSIQPVKPQQCRDFPNRWSFPGWREVCEATPELAKVQPAGVCRANKSDDKA
ncbi:MAG: YkgJ family cysteine cluster protein [Chthoniobacteraceae bacterium]